MSVAMPMDQKKLVIALTKGRILDEVLPLFARAGIEPSEDIQKSRKLIFSTNHGNVELMVIRGSDVTTYVELGSADMGVVGKDLLMEYGSEGFYEPLDLKLATCRLMTAAPIGSNFNHDTFSKQRLRIASKFVNITKRYFAEQGRQVEIVKLNGALELAPSMGLADAIVDIVDSGKTLKANGLEPMELIANVSSRVIVNKAAMKVKNRSIREILDRLQTAVDTGSKDS
jgi:ATP phosphoribosyltransferase